jgi:catechol 2,3-dioxygenase-like lactoylglutathione lyase family enzyme
MTDASYHHVGLRVTDLDRATRWYEEALGYRFETSHKLPHADVRVAFMVNGADERVELFEFSDGEPTPSWSHPDLALARGFSHFALRVADIEASFAQAEAAGARVLWAPRHAAPLGTRTAYIADPDDNLIEFVEATGQG